MNKKHKSIMALVVACVVLGVMGTIAYFTSTETATNVITMGNVDATLTEPIFSETPNSVVTTETVQNPDGTTSTNTVVEKTGVTPGDKIMKDPTMTNTGNEDARVKVTATIAWKNGTAPVAGAVLPTFADLGIEANTGWTATGLNSTTATFLLNNVLTPGSASCCFKSTTDSDGTYTMSIPTDFNYNGSTFEIKVVGKAIQAANTTAADL